MRTRRDLPQASFSGALDRATSRHAWLQASSSGASNCGDDRTRRVLAARIDAAILLARTADWTLTLDVIVEPGTIEHRSAGRIVARAPVTKATRPERSMV
jgi:hypothetical protein